MVGTSPNGPASQNTSPMMMKENGTSSTAAAEGPVRNSRTVSKSFTRATWAPTVELSVVAGGKRIRRSSTDRPTNTSIRAPTLASSRARRPRMASSPITASPTPMSSEISVIADPAPTTRS